MIILGLLCLRLAMNIRSHDKSNTIWSYLAWVCSGLVIFAVSRSTGHIESQRCRLNRPRINGATVAGCDLLNGGVKKFFRIVPKNIRSVFS